MLHKDTDDHVLADAIATVKQCRISSGVNSKNHGLLGVTMEWASRMDCAGQSCATDTLNARSVIRFEKTFEITIS